VFPNRRPQLAVLLTAHYDTINLIRHPVSSGDARIAEIVSERGMSEADARQYAKLLRPSPRSIRSEQYCARTPAISRH
jgi:hypothetical protein